MNYDREVRETLEKQILSSLLNNSKLFFEKKHALEPDFFRGFTHKLIYSAIDKSATEFQMVDLVTVEQSMQGYSSDEISFQEVLDLITENKAYKGKNFDKLCITLFEFITCDNLLNLSKEILETDKHHLDESMDFDSVVNGWKADMTSFNIDGGLEADSIEESVDETIDLIMSRMHNKKSIIGVTTSVDSLDDFTSGWLSPDLIILAGRPGMGKSAFAIQNALHIGLTKERKSCAFYSYEMPTSQILERMAANMTNINSKKMLKGQLDETEFSLVKTAMERIKETNINIFDVEYSLSKLLNSIRYQKLKNNIEIAFIDYAQLITNDIDKSNSQDVLIGGISKRLKQLCMELKIPIILLSQLSRAVESRGGMKKPMSSDLRGSGSLEQDADVIMFFYRPAYYKIDMDAYFNKGESLCQGLMTKGRRIGVRDFDFYYKLKTNTFKDWDNNPFSNDSPY